MDFVFVDAEQDGVNLATVAEGFVLALFVPAFDGQRSDGRAARGNATLAAALHGCFLDTLRSDA
ncbi:MAG: hypothetical protein L0Z53_00475 [Acidobacteriales bacterium]|nr:hypothetical protein [Terriglobales bacterium]